MDETHSELTKISTLQKTVVFKIDRTNECSSRSLDKSLTEISDITDLTISKVYKITKNENINNSEEYTFPESKSSSEKRESDKSIITVVVSHDMEKSTSLSSKKNQIDELSFNKAKNEEVNISIEITNDEITKTDMLENCQSFNIESDIHEENRKFEISEIADDNISVEKLSSINHLENVENQYEKSKILPHISEQADLTSNPIIEGITEDPEELLSIRQSLLSQIHQAMHERRHLTKMNDSLQCKLWGIFRRKRPNAATKMQKILSVQDSAIVDTDQRYNEYLQTIMGLQKELYIFNEDKKQSIKMLVLEAQRKEEIILSKTNELTVYRHQIALTTANSHTGKKLLSSEWELMMANEKKKNLEVQSVRLECIKLGNKVKKFRATVMSRELVGNKISLMDFEQIKIENQALNEKLADGLESVRKLKVKIENSIHILTHFKEKIIFGISEVEKTAENDKENRFVVNTARKQLTNLKYDRELINKSNERIIRMGGLLNRTGLLKHFDLTVDKIQKQKNHIREMNEIINSNPKLLVKSSNNS